MKIERAVREQTYTLTSIAGPSGSGKTYSALLYARGLVGPEGKIGFIDTENKRSRFYADVAGGFDVIDLDPPFTSERYIEAIKKFEDAGYKAIIIDSVSHEWEGTGGVLEQAEAIQLRTKRSGLHCWQKPKAGHKKLMNNLLQTRAHLILCCRVKEKVTQANGADGKTEIVNEGFVVVQEKSFIYEMTISLMLQEGNHFPIIQKCPGDLLSAFPKGKKVSPEVGDAVKKWSEQGESVDQEFEAAKLAGLEASQSGLNSLMEWWKGLTPALQKRLEGMKETFKSVANATDEINNIASDAAMSPSERLKQSKNASESDQGADEGFSTSHVQDAIADPSTGEILDNETSAAPPSAERAVGVDASATEGGGEELASPPSEELLAATKAWFGYAKDAAERGVTKELIQQYRDNFEKLVPARKEKVPEHEHDQLKSVMLAVDAVIKGEQDYETSVGFFAEAMGFDPETFEVSHA